MRLVCVCTWSFHTHKMSLFHSWPGYWFKNVFCFVSLSKADQIFNAACLIYNSIYFRVHKVQNVEKIAHLWIKPILRALHKWKLIVLPSLTWRATGSVATLHRYRTVLGLLSFTNLCRLCLHKILSAPSTLPAPEPHILFFFLCVCFFSVVYAAHACV